MSKIEKNAGLIAAEIVENYIKLGVELDDDYISDKSCSIAYKIHEKSKAYKHDDEDELSEKKIKKLIKEAINESRPEVHVTSGSGASHNS